MSASLDALNAQVAANNDLIVRAIAAIQGSAASSAELDAVAAAVKASDDALAAVLPPPVA